MKRFAFLNGRLIPEALAVVSILDRSFLYGDGLFETIAVHRGQPFRWNQHLERLRQGMAFLRFQLPLTEERLHKSALRLIEVNRLPESILRLTLSRGVGVRGYSTRGATQPVVAMSLHPGPAARPRSGPRWKLVTASARLPSGDPLARFKTCNKLTQIMARLEAEERGADEALLLDDRGHVAEGASSNFFWVERGGICTPPLACGVLPGVTRAVVFEICAKLGLRVRERRISPGRLRGAGAFLSMSSMGVVAVSMLDGRALPAVPLVPEIQKAYRSLMETECAGWKEVSTRSSRS